MTAVDEAVAETAGPVPPEDRPIEELADALDRAIAAQVDIDRLSQRVVEDVKKALEDIHRAAIVTIVRSLRDDPRGKELLFDLVDDPAVRLVLLMHGLIRPDPMTQAQEALDTVRPQLQSHGGDVELDRIEDGVAYVRLSGACNGCSMSAVTMRNGVEEALVAAVPGVSAVEVLPNEPGPTLIPLSEMGLGGGGAVSAETGWVEAMELDAFELGAVTVVEAANAVVVNLAGQLTAYVNECAHMGLPLDDAEIDATTGTLTCSWHGYCFDALSGECTSLPGAQLAQLPLRVDNGRVWIRMDA
jgi:Fe-S cluster biogenesis protein NfuA/nitrite reductase/ring-hydroxylating ferredoxin subunit